MLVNANNLSSEDQSKGFYVPFQFQRKLFERLGLLVIHLICLTFVVILRPTELERLTYSENLQWDDWVSFLYCFLSSFFLLNNYFPGAPVF